MTKISPTWQSALDQLRATKTETMCQWFLGCRSEATKTIPHPVLGAVPICDHCARMMTTGSI